MSTCHPPEFLLRTKYSELLVPCFFFKFLPIMSMELQANDPQVEVNLDPMGMVGRTYVVDH